MDILSSAKVQKYYSTTMLTNQPSIHSSVLDGSLAPPSLSSVMVRFSSDLLFVKLRARVKKPCLKPKVVR
ncbi:hypothetical protein KCU88_g366, partial [Aureobasidium melanogenum]